MKSFFDSLLSNGLPGAKSDRLRVLVVEDHPDLARIMTWLLHHFGFETETASSGLTAYPTAVSFRPHFVLLDLKLPGLDGYQVARLIRDDPTLSHVVIIAASAYGPDIYPDRIRSAGFDHHLTKPFEITDLLPLLVPR